jgi:alpha-glucosidase (family GH31 glycosyl hydrolase)
MLGAFYPFSRNHNSWNSAPQEPYQFANEIYEDGITYLDIMRTAMRIKYSLVRYYYTELSLIHKNGGVIIKPLFFEFPDCLGCFNDNTFGARTVNNFMIGSALKVGINSD